jgi:hypothetical protein
VEVVPSLQTTAPLPLDGEELAAGAAAGAEAGVGALPAPALLLVEADLFTPPCPLHAPRPPCGEVVPSLHTTGPVEVLCAEEIAGAVSSAAASRTLMAVSLDFILMRLIAVLPFEPCIIPRRAEYRNHSAGGTSSRT